MNSSNEINLFMEKKRQVSTEYHTSLELNDPTSFETI